MPEHFYGWTPSLPDQRDIIYSAPREALEALPPAIDLSTPALPPPFEPVFDQGRLGSCGPQTESSDIIFSAWLGGISPIPPPSRLFLYYTTRMEMGTVGSDSGVSNRVMLKALAKYGWCDESLWPYDPVRFTQRPPQACWDQAALRKDSKYESVPQSLSQMKAVLAGNDPFIFGFTVYESFESQQVVQTGIVPMPRQNERVLGGHDVLIVGYDDSTQRFKFKNSWGRDWGANGYGWFPYSFCINPQISGDFWTVQHAAFPAPAPPIPPVPPTPLPGAVKYVILADASNQELSRFVVA